MADYFKDNPDAFDFKPGSVGDKATKFSDQFEVVLIKLQKDLVYFNLELIL